MRSDLPSNIRLEPLHNLNITRIRNHSKPMCGGRLLRAYAHFLPDRMSRGMTSIAFSRRLISELEKGESGGYTVLAIDHNIRVKASDVFRNNFAGKINRQATETALGPWTPASTSGYEADQHGAQH